MISLLRVLHILLAIAALGTNLTFPIWTRLAERDGSSLAFTLTGVRFVDRWVTIPSYLLCAITGVALVLALGIPFGAAWVWVSIALLVLLMALGFGPYRPLSRLRLELARDGGSGTEYRAADRRIDYLDGAILGAAVLITVLMTVRPV
ncbi:MAG: DUF2269 family protein [Chloroflexota bacterium]|nr:DUF2269 family protein [Chloroflexota bacterium]